MIVAEPTKSQLKIRELNDEIQEVALKLQKEKEKFDSQLIEANQLVERKQRLREENRVLEEEGEKIVHSLKKQVNLLNNNIGDKTVAESKLKVSLGAFEAAIMRADDSLKSAKDAEERRGKANEQHDKLLGITENLKEKVFESEERVRLNNTESEKAQGIAKKLMEQAQEMIDKVGIFNQTAEEWYKKLKFYARRLKKHLMAHGHPFPKELEDLRHEKVFFKDPKNYGKRTTKGTFIS